MSELLPSSFLNKTVPHVLHARPSHMSRFICSPFFILAQQPPVGQGLLIHEVSRAHTTMHNSR